MLEEIERKRGSHFDPRVVDAFLKVIDEFRGETWEAPDAPAAAAETAPGGELPDAAPPAVEEDVIAARALGSRGPGGREPRGGRVPR